MQYYRHDDALARLRAIRRSIASNRTQATSTKPSLLLSMPQEILAEIESHLLPIDLLNLARTTKELRRKLMSKTSKTIWASSRKTYCIPDCPSDLSEPQYAEYIFGRGCSFCKSQSDGQTYIHLRVRVCEDCKESRLIRREEIEERLVDSGVIPITSWRVVCDLFPFTSRGACYRHDYEFALLSDYKSVYFTLGNYDEGTEERNLYLHKRAKLSRAIIDSSNIIAPWVNVFSPEMRDVDLRVMGKRIACFNEKASLAGLCDENIFPPDRLEQIYVDLAFMPPKASEDWAYIRGDIDEMITDAREKQLHRQQRHKEATARYNLFSPQLQQITRSKLYLKEDSFGTCFSVSHFQWDAWDEFPITDELWNIIQRKILISVPEVVKEIQEDCFYTVLSAKTDAACIGRDRRDRMRRSNLRGLAKEQSVNGGSSSDDRLQSISQEICHENYQVEKEYLFENDWKRRDEYAADEDLVPTRLLSAQSLFEREERGVKTIMSYEAILRKRAKVHDAQLSSSEVKGVAWKSEKITSSGVLVDTAVMLLKYLGLSVRTRHAFMDACGDVFVCRRCHDESNSKGMSWPQLVDHFLRRRQQVSDLRKRRRFENLYLLLVDDHSLELDFVLSQGKGAPVQILAGRELVNADIDISDADVRYSELATTWKL